MVDFARCLPVILKFEGGKVDNPKDPGGRTNQGITQTVYNAYRRRKGVQQRDVYLITPEERDEIYRAQYWNPIRGDQLPLGVDLVVFDGATNSGPSQSIKWLQRALGVKDDGVLGPDTLHAINVTTDNDALIADIIAKREAFLKNLKTFKTFGTGWLSRTLQVEQIGQAWATGTIGPNPFYAEGAHAKANVEDIKKPPAKGLADVATGSGVGSGVAAGTIQTLQEQLTPFSMAGGWITKLVVALAIISAVLTIGGLAWRWYSSYRKVKIEKATTT